ncbi:MAG: acyltransferase domain-containing protein, partial [Acidimicrobiales bacterium]|nr:acyltransferase domain-containing protein [Acidimicrobiales bacterium]
IYAVIEAVRGASDGRALGLTAPRADGQRRALERAYAQAGRSPATLGLVEAHGTGTVVGDATELATLTEVFTQHGAAPGSCVLGSVKSQIGHTKCAAGLAGVIKAAQAVYRGVLPPTLGIDEPNPRYDADKSPFRFNDAARPWADVERRAGVSAFGFGGTNFHAVLTRYAGEDDPAHGLEVWPAELVLLRARDADAARARIETLAALVGRIVAEDPAGERHKLRDLARTVCEEGDPGLPVLVALVADDLAHLGRQLAAVLDGAGTAADGVFTAVSMAGPAEASAEPSAPGTASGDVALLFPGQGSQRVGMLADLFVAFPRLRRHLRAGDRWADAVYPARAFTDEARAAQTAALTDTRVAQPALGVAGLAVADLLAQVGVVPAATAGHSYGELVALCVAGALDEAALLDLSAARGDAVHDAAARAADPGAMAAVAATAADLASHLASHPQVVLANHNGPRQTVVAGPTAAIDALVADLRAARVTARKLPVACAFHSPLVAAARDTLADALAQAPVASPRVPVWSNSTAEPYPSDPDGVRRLLADQVGEPVRFVEQIEAMYAAGVRTFVEAGPGRVLTGLVRSILGERPHRAVACDAGGDGSVRGFLRALAELAAGGVPVDTDVLFTDRAAPVELATLPHPRPGWTVDGHLVRTAAGAPVAGGLRPATENPDLIAALGGVAGGTIGATAAGSPAPGTVGAADVVATYLENLRQTVAAERDVMLRYLDGNPGGPVTVRGPGVAAGTGAGSLVAVEVAEVGTEIQVEVAETGPPTRGAPVDLLTALTDIVAARTGYPHDMLAPDLDLEADLSIDSIKRVEIIGEVAERIGLPGAAVGVVDDDM